MYSDYFNKLTVSEALIVETNHKKVAHINIFCYNIIVGYQMACFQNIVSLKP